MQKICIIMGPCVFGHHPYFFWKNINPARADSEKKEMQHYFCTALNLRPTAGLTSGFQECTEELNPKRRYNTHKKLHAPLELPNL
jgi:hypothetical protein